jgi:arylsulfatase I/J
MSNWDGGIRGNAFVSGGFLPPAVRGTKFEGLVAVWDWYSTFCAVVRQTIHFQDLSSWAVKSTIRLCLQAGVSAIDRRAAAASLPPIDSLSMVDVLLGTGPSPRTSLPLGTEPRKSSLYLSGTTVNGLIEQDE